MHDINDDRAPGNMLIYFRRRLISSHSIHDHLCLGSSMLKVLD